MTKHVLLSANVDASTRQPEQAHGIPACLICGIGFDQITGCVHTRGAAYAPAPTVVLRGPGGVFLVDQAAPVIVPINSIGLPIVDRS
jgi:hypothetical protein